MKEASAQFQYGIIVHGGAGSFVASREIGERRRALSRSAEAGYGILRRKGGSSLDAVEEAIKILEDSKVFNAGSGSSLSIEGRVSADAAIMTGQLDCGAIGNVRIAKNPISLARRVMDTSDHVLLVGDGELRKFSHAIDFRSLPLKPSKRRLVQYKQNLALMKRGKIGTWSHNYKLLNSYFSNDLARSPENNDTVGAVAIDQTSEVCAGVSTGGRWLKLPGRVGDSAVVGAGIYADNFSGAASATGAGEEIIRLCLCKTICDLMRRDVGAQAACDAAISILTSRRGVGTAGVIAVDKYGRFGTSRNTEMLQRAFRFSSMTKVYVAILPSDKDPLPKRPDLGDPKLKF